MPKAFLQGSSQSQASQSTPPCRDLVPGWGAVAASAVCCPPALPPALSPHLRGWLSIWWHPVLSLQPAAKLNELISEHSEIPRWKSRVITKQHPVVLRVIAVTTATTPLPSRQSTGVNGELCTAN